MNRLPYKWRIMFLGAFISLTWQLFYTIGVVVAAPNVDAALPLVCYGGIALGLLWFVWSLVAGRFAAYLSHRVNPCAEYYCSLCGSESVPFSTVGSITKRVCCHACGHQDEVGDDGHV